MPNNLPPLPHSHTQKWQHAAAELFEQRRQGSSNGNVRALAAAHPWMSVAAAAVAAGGGQGHLLRSACAGVGWLTHRAMLLACGPRWQGGAAGLSSLGLCWGRAADALARAACLRPEAKVGGGQWRLRAHPWTSVAATAPAGEGAVTAQLASGSGR